MARADLLKRLFASHRANDHEAFQEAAGEVIQDERRKHHDILANELASILRNSRRLEPLNGTSLQAQPIPKDRDTGTPLLTVKVPDRYREEVILREAVRKVLDRVLREYSSSEVLASHNLRPIGKVLFCGPPGCGKTVGAEMLATELGLPLVSIRFDSIVSSLLGETSTNLRKVFDFIDQGHWVVFFDEFDGIGRSRDDVTEHGEIKRVINSFLQLLDSYKGLSLIVAATNYEKVLDPAIWRRFDEVIHFPLPTSAEIKRLVEQKLASVRISGRLIQKLVAAMSEASFADAERVCIDILKQCALEGMTQAKREHIDLALSRWVERNKIVGLQRLEAEPKIDRE